MRNYCNLLYIFLPFIFNSCSDNNNQELVDIQNYIVENDLNAIEYTEGVFIHFYEKGGEEKPKANSDIILSYTGYYLDNEPFDESNKGKSVKLNLHTTVQGLKQSLTYFGKGGKGTIIIPSRLGFGNNPPRGIRKNAVLLYDIEVYDFN